MRHHYGPRGGHKESVNYDTRARCQERWILNQAGEFFSADAVTVQTLSNEYDRHSIGAEALIRFLGIRDEGQSTVRLSDEQARKIKLADEIERLGLTEDEIRAAIEDAQRKKSVQPSTNKADDSSEQITPESTLIQEIEKRRPSVKNTKLSNHQENDFTPLPPRPSDASEDADDYTPKIVDYGKKLDRAKDRHASELDRIESEQALHDKANIAALQLWLVPRPAGIGMSGK